MTTRNLKEVTAVTSLAERAHATAVFIQRSAAISIHGSHRGEEYARIAVRLAAALGLDADDVTVTPDWLRCRTVPGEPALATVTDSGETYTFLVRCSYVEDEPFELLGPCPECAAQVPLADVRHLADLGMYLARGPAPLTDGPLPSSYPDTFANDEAHTGACGFGAQH
ncbi:hypothetical protein ACFQVC_21525 [Streptomyces monticola]|uniref:Uncharacterized protein n=1 Tax=Streptomyces monticola TaxID=2666263 RepID=A0ABW2JL02_9ACTN